MRNLDTYYMNIAIETSKLSYCIAHKVGAVIVKDNNIISIGYNGTPSGHINCCDAFAKGMFTRTEHHNWSNQFEGHAESSAIAQAAKTGKNINTSTLYCTLRPCWNCLKLIIQSGIVRVVYNEEYNKHDYSTNTGLNNKFQTVPTRT